MRAPEDAGVGVAKVTVSFEAWKEGKVKATEATMSVVPAKALPSKPVSPRLRASLPFEATGTAFGLAWSADGSTLAAAAREGCVTFWDVRTRRKKTSWKDAGAGLYSLGLTADGKTLATSHWSETEKTISKGGKAVRQFSFSGEVRLWDPATGKAKAAFKHAAPRGVHRMALAPDGKTLAAVEAWCTEDRTSTTAVCLWDVAAGKPRADLTMNANCLAFTGDSRTLAVGGAEVTLVDVGMGKAIGTLPLQKEKGGIVSIDFHPAGTLVAGAIHRGEVFLWDVARKELVGTLAHEKADITRAVAFSPDGKTLAIIVQEMPARRPPRSREEAPQPRIVLWDPAARKVRLTLTAPRGYLMSLAYSPDGKTLAAGTDQGVQLWDVEGVR